MDKSSSQRLQAVRGMYDLLPPDSRRLREVESASHRVLQTYGYLPIGTPIVEYTPLFARSIGEQTDIVEKEMYTFEDRDGRSLTMRPEGTASAVRAYVEHSFHKREAVTQWYYLGPMFRHERWQRGRYRQFHQLGVEALGVAGPGIDAEMLAMLVQLLDDMGLEQMELHLNTLGCPSCRPAYRQALEAALSPRQGELCEDCRRRFHTNPLRVLDCKEPGCQAIGASAPRILDLVCDDCREHWDGLLECLSALDLTFQVDKKLVRGLDYYTRTTFELTSTAGNLGSQNTVAGGGRYDGLVELLGGPPTPAVGFAMGLERLLLALGEELPALSAVSEVSFVTQGRAAHLAALPLARVLRQRGISVDVDHRGASFKSQLKRADRRGCALAVLIGEHELEREVVTIRQMETSEQRELPVGDVVAEVLRRLGAPARE